MGTPRGTRNNDIGLFMFVIFHFAIPIFSSNPIFSNTIQEAVGKVFQRALQYCDPKKVHLALLGMFGYRRIQWLLKQNQDGVQSVVNRALLSLPPHKHINFITQTAILEFKFLFKKYLEYEKSLGDYERMEAVKRKAMDMLRLCSLA
ncbi:hypothetical protein HAX54_002517 [Datura stramonium]|uniref:Uncharacterized protein n=1 Tax=Datura stramonium TaxID=4076 RepID=A0ABS8T4Q2_DATST|nr:hypothetical protein [Datura stramonium]